MGTSRACGWTCRDQLGGRRVGLSVTVSWDRVGRGEWAGRRNQSGSPRGACLQSIWAAFESCSSSDQACCSAGRRRRINEICCWRPRAAMLGVAMRRARRPAHASTSNAPSRLSRWHAAFDRPLAKSGEVWDAGCSARNQWGGGWWNRPAAGCVCLAPGEVIATFSPQWVEQVDFATFRRRSGASQSGCPRARIVLPGRGIGF